MPDSVGTCTVLVPPGFVVVDPVTLLVLGNCSIPKSLLEMFVAVLKVAVVSGLVLTQLDGREVAGAVLPIVPAVVLKIILTLL